METRVLEKLFLLGYIYIHRYWEMLLRTVVYKLRYLDDNKDTT